MTELDIDWVRRQFPALSHPDSAGWAHLENAGGSYVPRHVIDLLTTFFTTTKVQPYVAPGPSQVGGAAMDRAYELVPHTFNAPPELVHYGPSTSQNTYVLAHAVADLLEPGDEIIVTNQDHEANVGAWRRLERTGAVVKEWGVDADTGLLDVDDLDGLLSSNTRLVCVTHASNVAATVNPIPAIAQRVHAHDAWLFVDGVAHAPHAAIDVEALGCDAYFYSSYKTFGPHLGLMYTSEEVLGAVTNQGHYFNEANPKARLTPAGPDHAEIAASAGIVDYYLDVHRHHFGDSSASIAERISDVFELFSRHEHHLADRVLDLLETKDVRVAGATQRELRASRAPTIAFRSDRLDSRDVWSALADQRVACAHGNFYARRLVEAMGIPPDDGLLRLSLVHYNSDEEIDRVVAVLDRVL